MEIYCVNCHNLLIEIPNRERWCDDFYYLVCETCSCITYFVKDNMAGAIIHSSGPFGRPPYKTVSFETILSTVTYEEDMKHIEKCLGYTSQW